MTHSPSLYYLTAVLRLDIIESPAAYYQAVKRLSRIALLLTLPLFISILLPLPEGVNLLLLAGFIAVFFWEIRTTLRIRNNTKQRRLEVDEAGIGVQEVGKEARQLSFTWDELEAVELETGNNMANPSWAQSLAMFKGEEPKNFVAFRAGGQQYRFDVLFESDYAERRLRALMTERALIERGG